MTSYIISLKYLNSQPTVSNIFKLYNLKQIIRLSENLSNFNPKLFF